MRRGRWTVAPLLLAALALQLGGCDLVARLAPFPSLQGKVVWPKGGELSVLRLADRQETRLVQLTDPTEVITAAAWSPDGRQVVFAHVSRRAGARQSGADLRVIPADGGTPATLVEREEPTTLLDSPVWDRSGSIYYAEQRAGTTGESRRIMRRPSDGGPAETIAVGGFSPSLVPDGSAILYLKAERGGVELSKQSLGTRSSACVLVPQSSFSAITSHRPSPDGSRIAFVAAGEPPDPPPAGSCASGVARSPNLGAGLLLLWSWLGPGPRTALAHGMPSDLWLIDADGRNLRRLAKLQEDEAQLSWSPDGKALAVFGIRGLYAVDVASGQTRTLDEVSGFGAVDWAP